MLHPSTLNILYTFFQHKIWVGRSVGNNITHEFDPWAGNKDPECHMVRSKINKRVNKKNKEERKIVI